MANCSSGLQAMMNFVLFEPGAKRNHQAAKRLDGFQQGEVFKGFAYSFLCVC